MSHYCEKEGLYIYRLSWQMILIREKKVLLSSDDPEILIEAFPVKLITICFDNAAIAIALSLYEG